MGDGALHCGGLVGFEATISPTVKHVNEKMASDENYFSVRELSSSDWEGERRIYGRAPGAPIPRRKPKFPYKPPANSPPRRKPIAKRTPDLAEPLPLAGDPPDRDRGSQPCFQNRTSLT